MIFVGLRVPCEASLPRALHHSTDTKRILASRTVGPSCLSHPWTLAFSCAFLADLCVLQTLGPLCLSEIGLLDHCVWLTLGFLDPWDCCTLRTLGPFGILCPCALRTIGPLHSGEADRLEPTLSNDKTRAPCCEMSQNWRRLLGALFWRQAKHLPFAICQSKGPEAYPVTSPRAPGHLSPYPPRPPPPVAGVNLLV